MARLYQPTITTYRLPNGSYRTPDGQRVTKDTPGAVRHETVSKKWYGEYRDAKGVQRVPLSANEKTARRMFNKLLGDAEMARVGIVDPFAEHRGRELAEHLEDFRRYLAAKGNTQDHVQRTCNRIAEVLKGCAFTVPDDLDAPAVMDFLDRLKKRGRPRLELDPRQEWYKRAELADVLGINIASVARVLRRDGLNGQGAGKARRYARETVEALQERLCNGTGVTTCNHYLTAMKGFTRWLARNTRIAADPLAHLTRQNPDVDIRHERRALREEVFARFVEMTGQGKPFRGLTGPDRLVLYTLAAHTGFRADELGSLTPASFTLKAPATVTVQAAYSKHRRKDVQPLRPDVAEMMRQYIAGKPRNEPLWPGTWKEVAAEMIRGDLAAAGIPYQDEDGRVFDFHAMRGQFISQLAASGVHPKVAQVLARHSSITLTMDYYTHLDVLDVAGALDKLPEIPTAKPVDSTAPEAKKGAHHA
jgi:integrase